MKKSRGIRLTFVLPTLASQTKLNLHVFCAPVGKYVKELMTLVEKSKVQCLINTNFYVKFSSSPTPKLTNMLNEQF